MMYSNLGYTVYRQVLGYYSGENNEDAYGKIQSAKFVLFLSLITVAYSRFHFLINIFHLYSLYTHIFSFFLFILTLFPIFQYFVFNLFFIILHFTDMRKALNRDKKKLSMIPLKEPITPDQLEW